MNYILFLILVIMISSTNSHISELEERLNEPGLVKKSKNKSIMLKDYKNKLVHLNIDNDDIADFIPFSVGQDTFGHIIDFDTEWVEYRYYDKSKKREVTRFFRISNIESIEEESDEIDNDRRDRKKSRIRLQK